MSILLILLIFQSTFLIVLFLLAGSTYKELNQKYGEHFQLAFMTPVSLFILDKLKVMEKYSGKLLKIHHRIVGIYGQKNGLIYTKLFLAQVISAMILVLLFTTLFGSIQNNYDFVYFGLFLAIVTPLFLIKGLDKQLKKKQDSILLEASRIS